jgi:hypothetical protein
MSQSEEQNENELEEEVQEIDDQINEDNDQVVKVSQESQEDGTKKGRWSFFRNMWSNVKNFFGSFSKIGLIFVSLILFCVFAILACECSGIILLILGSLFFSDFDSNVCQINLNSNNDCKYGKQILYSAFVLVGLFSITFFISIFFLFKKEKDLLKKSFG